MHSVCAGRFAAKRSRVYIQRWKLPRRAGMIGRPPNQHADPRRVAAGAVGQASCLSHAITGPEPMPVGGNETPRLPVTGRKPVLLSDTVR